MARTSTKSPATRAKGKSLSLAFPVEFRLRIVKLYLEEGYRPKLLVEQFGISTHSIQRWVRAFHSVNFPQAASNRAMFSALRPRVSLLPVSLQRESASRYHRRVPSYSFFMNRVVVLKPKKIPLPEPDVI
jgi:transposase-like protein